MSEDEKGNVEECSSKLPTEPGNGLLIAGAVLSAAYLAFVLSQISWSEFQSLELNAKGDFLAGIFAPLAFLWLVLGFFQQGAELRNSAKALWAQMEELRNSVGQQESLVQATRDLREVEATIHADNQRRASRAIQPIFQILDAGSSPIHNNPDNWIYRFELQNAGTVCANLEVLLNGTAAFTKGAMPRGGMHRFNITAPTSDSWSRDGVISYIDEAGGRNEAKFEISRQNGTTVIDQPSWADPSDN